MGYVAGKNLTVERPLGSGKYVDLVVGDPVPECTEWPTFKQNVNVGNVVWVPDEDERKGKAAQKVAPHVIANGQVNSIAKKGEAKAAARTAAAKEAQVKQAPPFQVKTSVPAKTVGQVPVKKSSKVA